MSEFGLHADVAEDPEMVVLKEGESFPDRRWPRNLDDELNLLGEASLHQADTLHGSYSLSFPEEQVNSVQTIVAEPKLKIETLHSVELTRATISFVCSAIFTILYNIVFIVLANTAFGETLMLGAIEYTVVQEPYWFFLVEFIIQIIMSALLLASTLVFSLAIFTTTREKRTREMFFVIVLGFSVTLIFFPFMEIPFQLVFIYIDEDQVGLYHALLHVAAVLVGMVATFGIYFHLWSTTISYRTLGEQSFPLSYYLKMGFLCFTILLRLMASIFARVDFNWAPFTSLAISIGKFSVEGVGLGPSQLALVIFNSVVEFLLLVLIWADMRKTREFVFSLDYLKFRSTQIGFRQLQYYSTITMIITVVSSVIVTLCSPDDNILLVSKYIGELFFEPTSGRLTYIFVIAAFTLQQLYYMLPASEASLVDLIFFCWRRRAKEVNSDTLFRYRVLERFEDPGFKPTSFVLETCISLFNLSWITYSYGETNKRLRDPREFGNTQCSVSKYAAGSATDTHALVYDAPDRIIVAFKGTTSGQNVRTDFNSRLLPLEKFLGAETDDLRTRWGLSRFRSNFRRFGNRPMVHAGFARAYEDVRLEINEEVDRLYAMRPRPIFFTGHSLGGALASLCALDAQARLQSPGGVYVFTFGSPKVGNHAFAKVFNEKVPCCWRVVLAKDPITRLPPGFSFAHIGNSALITEEGHLFIDPTLFELAWMHSGFFRFNLRHHRKSGYASALEEFIAKRHGSKMGNRLQIWNRTLVTSSQTTTVTSRAEFATMTTY
ncbi:hypothetical protein NDN08_002467 [Rhodosorus marinus]|uniref:Fungal lipase-type domain-containing protein n=1 Tax=Rhodosorus marinus TaxID=101924 RepID=A0AAV8UZK3_9RHOD|nr:hypothetical protein NDN08_002467 [Rhodosorus marinus]